MLKFWKWFSTGFTQAINVKRFKHLIQFITKKLMILKVKYHLVNFKLPLKNGMPSPIFSQFLSFQIIREILVERNLKRCMNYTS